MKYQIIFECENKEVANNIKAYIDYSLGIKLCSSAKLINKNLK